MEQRGTVTEIDWRTLKLFDLSKARVRISMKERSVLPALIKVTDGDWVFTISVAVIGAEDVRRGRVMGESTQEVFASHSRTGGGRLSLLITKGLIDQGLQIMIIVITYGALTVRNLDIHKKNVGNFIVSQLHLAKSGDTTEGNRGIIGKQTCLLLNQLKKNPWNKVDSIKRRLKK